MPKKTKDVNSKKETTKKTTIIDEKFTKSVDLKAEKSKKSNTQKTKKSTNTTKKTTTKKSVEKKDIILNEKLKKKKEPIKKLTTKKTNSKAKNEEKTTEIEFINEYYDLPYRYNQTIVTILAQTPTRLFVYWDISDEQRNKFIKQYGENFFEDTKPVLIVHNITLKYSFEIEINDFANSWYIPINDAKCEYTIELGRRINPNVYIEHSSADNNKINNEKMPEYIYIMSSNNLKTPNNKVLYNPPVYEKVLMRNVKTNQIIEKDIYDFKFIANIESIGEFYDVYGLYAKFYKDEDLTYINNPASGSVTSRSYSSQFK